MKKCLVILVSVMCFLSANAQMRWNAKYQSYIDQYKDLAIEEMIRYRVPASITLAQGILESGAGSSELTRKGNNHFGIKCHDWTGRTIYHDDDELQECSFKVMRIIANSCATGSDTEVFFHFLLPTIKDGLTA